MSAAGIIRAKEILANNSLSPTEIAIVYHLAIHDMPLSRSLRGIARTFKKDRRNLARVLRALHERGLLLRSGDLWSLPIAEQAAADVQEANSDGVIMTPPPSDTGGVTITPPPAYLLRRNRRNYDAPKKEKDKKRRAGRVSSSFSLKDLGRVARSEILSGRSAFVGGQVLKPGSPEFEALAQILRETPHNGGAVASQASGRLTAGPSVV